MPDKLIDSFIRFTHQNNGIFPKRRRNTFHMLKDNEIEALQSIFHDVFTSGKQVANITGIYLILCDNTLEYLNLCINICFYAKIATPPPPEKDVKCRFAGCLNTLFTGVFQSLVLTANIPVMFMHIFIILPVMSTQQFSQFSGFPG